MQSSEDLGPLNAILSSWRTGNIDPVNRIFWSLNRDLILKIASENSVKGERILDIGCGTGEYLISLTKEGKIGYGVDPLWETSLLKARDVMNIEGVSYQLIQSVGEKLPFKNGSFDMVLCISTLQHVSDQRTTLNEIRRVLGKNGRVVVSVPQTVRKSTFQKLGIYTMHFNLMILTDLLQDCGFSVKTTDVCGLFPPLSMKTLNFCYPVLGERITRKIVQILDHFAKIVPNIASSVIILAEVC